MALKDLFKQIELSTLPDYKQREVKDNLRQIAMNPKIRKEAEYNKELINITSAFYWHLTPQGADYWLNVTQNCRMTNYGTKTPH